MQKYVLKEYVRYKRWRNILFCTSWDLRFKITSLCTYPRIQVIRATDICEGLIVDNLPSLRSSASSWFNVTNSASIATMSPETQQITLVNIIFVTWKLICVSYLFFHAEFKYVIRTALAHTFFVRENFLKCNFSRFSSFCYTTSMFYIWLRKIIF